jgi:replicative DNA helicase
VIGALLLSPAALHSIADFITAEDFFSRQHRSAYAAICGLSEAGRTVDPLTVSEALVEAGGAPSDGWLMDLASNTPSAANIAAYAEIVVDNSRRRQAIAIADRLREAAINPKGQKIADIAGAATRELSALEPSRHGGLIHVKPIAKAWFEALRERYESKVIPGVPTGITALDDYTGGLQPGEVTILGGRSNQGKSALAFQVAGNVALAGQRIAVFSMETRAVRVMDRMVAAFAQIPYGWLLKPHDERDGYWPRINQAVSALAKSSLFIDESPRLTTQQISARAKREHMRHGLGLVIVDHLHELKLPNKQGEVIERGDSVRELKALAKELGCPVLVLAQLNRTATDQHGGAVQAPTVAQLRGSGGIEEAADLILMIHRPEVYDKSDRPGLAEIHVAKGRDVQTGEVLPLLARLDQMRFEAWDGPVPQRAEPKKGGTDWGDLTRK